MSNMSRIIEKMQNFIFMLKMHFCIGNIYWVSQMYAHILVLLTAQKWTNFSEDKNWKIYVLTKRSSIKIQRGLGCIIFSLLFFDTLKNILVTWRSSTWIGNTFIIKYIVNIIFYQILQSLPKRRAVQDVFLLQVWPTVAISTWADWSNLLICNKP